MKKFKKFNSWYTYIQTSPFNHGVDVCVGETIEDAAKLADHIFPPINCDSFVNGIHKMTQGYCGKIDDQDGETRVVMLISKKTSDEVLYHECLHASWYILSIVGVDLDVYNHEVQAYMQGWLRKQVRKQIRKL